MDFEIKGVTPQKNLETQTCKQEYASAGVTLAWAGSFFMYLILFHHFLKGENIFDA